LNRQTFKRDVFGGAIFDDGKIYDPKSTHGSRTYLRPGSGYGRGQPAGVCRSSTDFKAQHSKT
jgi:hypothetical protein